MKKFYSFFLSIVFLLIQFQAVSQFTDCYAEENWTIDISNTGPNTLTPGVVFDEAGETMTLTADGDFQGLSQNQPAGFDFDCSYEDGLVMACITIPADGTVSFDWNYTMQLFFEDPANEPFGYCLNGDNFVSLITPGLFDTQNGSASIEVTAGDQLCLVQASYFSEEFQAVTTVSNFSAPNLSSAPVFVSTSSHPLIGAWVDGHVTLTDGMNTYEYDVTEFDNIISDVAFGTYDYTFSQAGGCYPDVTGTLTVDCNAINQQSGNVLLSIVDQGSPITSAPVFVSTSSHPLIGAWVDGHVTLTDGMNTYDYDVTEFDNIIADVAFGTYDYTFSQAGGCYPDVTGTVVVDCDAIIPQSGNVFLSIIDQGSPITSAPVFVSTSSHPLIGAWVDGHVTLTDGMNTYDYDVTEFDNIIADVAFGTYDYTFSQAGGCYPDVTGTLTVDCDAIIEQSGNVLLSIIDQGVPSQTTAPVFVLTSSHPLIGAWVDGHVTLTNGINTYEYDVTEFDNIIADVVMGTYNYTFTQAGDCFESITGTIVVDCNAIIPESGNVLLNILDQGTPLTSAPVFVLTSNHPLIGSWVDGHVTLTDGMNTYEYDVTEFDNIINDVAFGTYDYTFTQAGGCHPDVTGTLTVDCDAIISESGNVLLNIIDQGAPTQTTAPVFVSTSSHPLIGAWVDGHVTLTDGFNTYEYDVTEFDNIIADVAMGTYNYTFSQAGGCYPDVTGTIVVDCNAIIPQSGNVFLSIIDQGTAITSAPVFVSTSSHPLIGAWVDGHVTLTDGMNTYEYDVTEFDNIIADVAFGTYDYTFSQAGGCYPDVTGTVTVDCESIIPQSGNIFLSIIDQGTAITLAPVFVSTSSHPLIGAWVDGHVTLTDGINTYEYDVTEFDNIIPDVAFGTYDYTFSQAGGCYPDVTGTVTVDCESIIPQSGNIFLSIIDQGTAITSAPVFVSTSSHPLIGAWVDGHVTLTDGINTYEYDVTEFDNIIADVAFGTYDYTFSQAGGCYPDVTGTVVVDCESIIPQSGNIFLSIIDQGTAITSAPVFVSTSSHPLIGAWVDGHVTLTDGNNTFEYDVTEFDNIIADVPFGAYDYTFSQAGGCYPEVTGTVTVDCDAIIPQSGNIFLSIIDQGTIIEIDTSVNQESNVLSANATGVSYQWVDCNNENAPIEGETNQSFTAMSNGSYAVIITDSNCPDSPEMSSCYEVTSVNTGDLDHSLTLTLYPNPVVDDLTIKLNEVYSNIEVQVYTVAGKMVRISKVTNSAEFKIDMAELSTGTYLIKVNADEFVHSSILVKE